VLKAVCAQGVCSRRTLYWNLLIGTVLNSTCDGQTLVSRTTWNTAKYHACKVPCSQMYCFSTIHCDARHIHAQAQLHPLAQSAPH
jgi:hypothetical protein